jgi:hypothetical protein
MTATINCPFDCSDLGGDRTLAASVTYRVEIAALEHDGLVEVTTAWSR